MRTLTIILLIALLPVGVLSGCSPATPLATVGEHLPGEGYNLAIILVDTLRPDYLGCYGSEDARTPIMDGLAEQGIRFENAYSASTFTGEAVASLFTGRPPVMNATGLGWTARPTPEAENLPRLLEKAGYKTGIFSTSFVMRFRGFYDSFQEAELFPGVDNTTALDDQLTDAALDFATRHKDEQTFQYLHYYAPHAPYNPPPEYLAPFEVNQDVLSPSEDLHPAALVTQGMQQDDPRLAEFQKHYKGEIAFIDQTIGRYLEGLRKLGTLSKTIVVLVSDHGEEFMEHGFADHAWNLYEETLRIPLVIHAPELLQPRLVQEKVSIYDVMPTVLRLLHIPHKPYENVVSGQYLIVPTDSQWAYAPRIGPIYASLFPESRAQLHAVLFDHYKYISGPRWLDAEQCKQFWLLQGTMATQARAADFLPLDPWAPAQRTALFDLKSDPGETKDASTDHPEVLERGNTLMKAYEKASEPYRAESGPTTKIDPFGEDFVHNSLKTLSEGASTPNADPEHQDSRIDPAVIESLETMGYL